MKELEAITRWPTWVRRLSETVAPFHVVPEPKRRLPSE